MLTLHKEQNSKNDPNDVAGHPVVGADRTERDQHNQGKHLSSGALRFIA